MTLAELWDSLDDFTHGYIECAIWASTDDDGKPLDQSKDWTDIDYATLEAIAADCKQFQEAHGAALLQAEVFGRTMAHHGHDYFLTRNGHGAGFWDRGYPAELGKALTEAAKAEGSDDWYIGDDGKVYRA